MRRDEKAPPRRGFLFLTTLQSWNRAPQLQWSPSTCLARAPHAQNVDALVNHFVAKFVPRNDQAAYVAGGISAKSLAHARMFAQDFSGRYQLLNSGGGCHRIHLLEEHI